MGLIVPLYIKQWLYVTLNTVYTLGGHTIYRDKNMLEKIQRVPVASRPKLIPGLIYVKHEDV